MDTNEHKIRADKKETKHLRLGFQKAMIGKPYMKTRPNGKHKIDKLVQYLSVIFEVQDSLEASL